MKNNLYFENLSRLSDGSRSIPFHSENETRAACTGMQRNARQGFISALRLIFKAFYTTAHKRMGTLRTMIVSKFVASLTS